jgi:choline-glycine betaine transporter
MNKLVRALTVTVATIAGALVALFILTRDALTAVKNVIVAGSLPFTVLLLTLATSVSVVMANNNPRYELSATCVVALSLVWFAWVIMDAVKNSENFNHSA